MWCNPVSASASINLILSAVLIGPGSIWNPSRGPSSWMSTCFGRSVMVLFLGKDGTGFQRCIKPPNSRAVQLTAIQSAPDPKRAGHDAGAHGRGADRRISQDGAAAAVRPWAAVIAPVERRAERLLPRQRRAAPA